MMPNDSVVPTFVAVAFAEIVIVLVAVLIAVIVAPAGIPVPVTDMPVARPIVDDRPVIWLLPVVVFPSWVPPAVRLPYDRVNVPAGLLANANVCTSLTPVLTALNVAIGTSYP